MYWRVSLSQVLSVFNHSKTQFAHIPKFTRVCLCLLLYDPARTAFFSPFKYSCRHRKFSSPPPPPPPSVICSKVEAFVAYIKRTSQSVSVYSFSQTLHENLFNILFPVFFSYTSATSDLIN